MGLSSTNYTDLVNNGATILDVRSKDEYSRGNINGSMNIAVNQLENNLHKLKDKNAAIITCCASGMRSATAKNILENNGYQAVFNGGGWQRLNQKIG